MPWICTDWTVDTTAIAAYSGLIFGLWGIYSQWANSKRRAALAAGALYLHILHVLSSLRQTRDAMDAVSDLRDGEALAILYIIIFRLKGMTSFGDNDLALARDLGPVAGKYVVYLFANLQEMQRLADTVEDVHALSVSARIEMLDSLQRMLAETIVAAIHAYDWAWKTAKHQGKAPDPGRTEVRQVSVWPWQRSWWRLARDTIREWLG